MKDIIVLIEKKDESRIDSCIFVESLCIQPNVMALIKAFGLDMEQRSYTVAQFLYWKIDNE